MTLTAPPIEPGEIIAALTLLDEQGHKVITDGQFRTVFAARRGFHPALRDARDTGHITIRRTRDSNGQRTRYITLSRNAHHLPVGGSR